MAHIVEEVKPYEWSLTEAFSSGRTAYRIGVERSDNPFKNVLFSTEWTKGWDEASASCTFKRKVDHSTPEDRNERRPKFRGQGRSFVGDKDEEFRNNRNPRARR